MIFIVPLHFNQGETESKIARKPVNRGGLMAWLLFLSVYDEAVSGNMFSRLTQSTNSVFSPLSIARA